ncbi:MAG: hypothetical protein ACREO5_13850, partial [Candidatus Binatia bacterium]
ALDEYFGADYLNSLPVTEAQATRLAKLQGVQDSAWEAAHRNGPPPEVLQARRIHQLGEDFISMMKRTNLAAVGGDWPSFMRDMFDVKNSSRWPRLDQDTVERTLSNVNSVLAKSQSETDPKRAQILESTALQMMRQAAEPKLTNQSQHPTCTMGSLEYYYWKMFPDEASRVISETLLNNGKFVTADGTGVTLTRSDMTPRPGTLRVQERYEFNQAPPRSYASQLFQMMAPNIYWQRQTATPDGRYAPQGSIRYRMTATGDELVQKAPLSLRTRVLSDSPYVSTVNILHDIGEQIGGARTIPNTIEWGTQFKTRNDFIRKVLTFGGEPVIVAIDHENWLDPTKPAVNTSHAITL